MDGVAAAAYCGMGGGEMTKATGDAYLTLLRGVHETIWKLDRAAERLEKASRQMTNQPPGANYMQGNNGAAHMASQAAGMLRQLIASDAPPTVQAEADHIALTGLFERHALKPTPLERSR